MIEETVLPVVLDGQTYVLRGTASEERLRQAAAIVAQKIDAARVTNPLYSYTRTAMLAALQIAEEFLALQDECREILEAADIKWAATQPK